MSYYEDETTADALEAWCEERRDADMLQAGYERESRMYEAAAAAGRCTHSSGVSLPASGEIFYAAQRGLTGTQCRCTAGCGEIFEDSDAMYRAGRDAAYGD